MNDISYTPCPPHEGLTKREYLAAMAMNGLLGNQEWISNSIAIHGFRTDHVVAEIATQYADALLEKLNN
jgi:hypothetical protein